MILSEVRCLVQKEITWRKVKSVFLIGRLDTGNELFGVNDNNGRLFAVAEVTSYPPKANIIF